MVVKSYTNGGYKMASKKTEKEIHTLQEETVFISEADQYVFGQGTHYDIYKKLGAHPCTKDGKKGVFFAVWAPHAREVHVVGSFNGWDIYANPMRKLGDGGIYSTFIPEVKEGDLYKFYITTASGEGIYKADPFANYAELRPGTASVVYNLHKIKWSDDDWMSARQGKTYFQEPMAIYECHIGSWMKHPDGTEDGFYNYREFADRICEYLSKVKYTHIELMGIAEHPYDGSWGYQVTGYFAPTSRFGKAEDLQYFIDRCHQEGIGVILDWVPGHFPKDQHGLINFDGTALYEHADPRLGEHMDWGTKIFNYGRYEVKNFLISNALYWVDKFHFDGLRVDAVASMLYLDYSRKEGQWIPNKYGGRENLEAIEFFKHLNSIMPQYYPGVMIIAEESTSFAGVTKPTYANGLGFEFKWNMGWMNDTLKYMEKDPVYRKYHHSNLTFSFLYAWSENFVLPISHDEVVHGKGSMINKMPGDYWQKFANLRAFYSYMWTHPGKQLLFMGQEFGQFDEWNEEKSLDWHLLDFDFHRGLKECIKDLNALYKNEKALWEKDANPEGSGHIKKGIYCRIESVCYNQLLHNTPAKPDKALYNIIRI